MATIRIGALVDRIDSKEDRPPTYVFSNGREFFNYDIPSAGGWEGTAISDGSGFVLSDGEHIIIDG